MLQPEISVDKLNALINDPSVYPWVCGELSGYLDLTPIFNNKENVFFGLEHGGCGFIKLKPGIYDFHSFCLPAGRGRWAITSAKDCIRWMFENTDAQELITACPQNNRPAIGGARALGFKKHSTVKNSWKYEGEFFDADIYTMNKISFGGQTCQSVH